MRTHNEQKMENHKKKGVTAGTLRTAEMKGMDLITKFSLMMVFTILFSIFSYDGLYMPKSIQAAITVQQSWTKLYDSASSPGNLTYTVNAGSNRLLVVAVTSSVSSSDTQTATATFGGNALMQQVGDGGTSARMHTWLFYLKDIPAVMDGASHTLNVTVTGTSMVNNTVYVAVFSGVDQSAPITDSRNENTGFSGVTSIAFSPVLTVNAGDQAVYVSNIYNSSSTTIPSYTLPVNWTSRANGTGTGSGIAWKTEVCNRTIPGTDTTDTANITSISPSSRVSMSGMSIKATPVCVRNDPTVTIGDPTSRNIIVGQSVNYTVSVTNNDTIGCAPMTYTLSKTDTPAVPNSNFSTSSLAATSTGSLNPSATWTTTLTHTATAGAAVGSTEQTSVTTAADANHSAVTTPDRAVSTVVEQNAKIVYSINTDTPQYRDYDGSLNSFGAQTATIAGATNQTFMVDRACPAADEHIAGYVTTGGVLYIMRWDGTTWHNEWNVTVGGNGITGSRFDIAYGNIGGEAMVVYSNNTAGQFVYRIWGGTSWTDPTTVNMSRLSGVVTSLRLAARPAAVGEGFAVAALDSGGRLSAMIYDTSTETWGNEPSQALSTNVYRSSNPGDVPAFDLAYENTSGDLLVVNTTNGTNDINYWTYSGSTWSGSNTFITNNSCGAIFVATDTNPGSNNILVAATDTVHGFGTYRTIYAGIWNGTSFSTCNSATSMGSNLSANRMPLRGGFVTSGETTAAVIVYNDGTANRLGYSYTTNAGTSWTTGQTATVTIGNGTKAWINSSVSPKIADTMMITLSDSNSDLWAKRLVLSAGPTFTWTDADGGTALTTTLATISAQNFSFAYDMFVNSTVLADGIQGASATVCPGDANQKIDGFSFNILAGTDSVTAITVITTNQAAIASMQIWDEEGTTQYFGTVNNPGSDTWNFSGGTLIPVTEDVLNYKILVTYKGYGTAPAGNSPTTAYVSAYTCTNIKTGIDNAGTTLTLDNSPALAATWGVNSGGMGTATLNWTQGIGGDSVMIVRYTTNTDTTMPADGTTYDVNDPYGSGGTVAYNGAATTFLDTGLAPGTYYYRIFEYSDCLKYATSAPWTEAIPIVSANQTAAGTATATLDSATSIAVTMPYSYDSNTNNTYTVDYKLSSSGTWTNWVTNASHSVSPYTVTITGLEDKQTYDVRCTYNDPDGVAGSNPQIISGIILVNNLLHNSITTGSTKWGPNGWGISGGQYGEFTCGTCHTPRATNIKGVTSSVLAPSGSFPGSTVNFQNTTALGGFGDDTITHTSSNKICEVCHTLTNYHRYNQSTVALHESSVGIYDCTECHPHNKGFKPVGGCSICHSLQLGNRVAVVGQFSGNSHHVQGVALTDQQCYQCHWEAKSDGSVNTAYHPGTSGASVDLVIYGSGVRPTTYSEATAIQYTANGTRAEIQKINQHCLGCHSAQNSTIQPFGDGKTPNQYAWDGMSIDGRYSQMGTTPWGKYSGANVTPKNTQTKAYSAHGNAANNQRGWNLTETWPDTSGIANVFCFDCHNSHGSTVTGTTTSYTSATTNGGILKDTTAGRGGYTMTYKPQAGGSVGNHNLYNPGAAICFDCHVTASSGTNPWGYQSTFGATQAITGYTDSPYFGPSASGPKQRYTYKASVGGPKGGHFGESSPLTTPAMGTIGGLCTQCHDPHGASPTLNQAYSVPLLKGTWMTSPYKEDAAPSATNESRGGGGRSRGGRGEPSWNGGSTPGYHIDQNTFNTTWNWNSTTRITQTVNEFGGLCLKCHPKSSIAPGTDSTWKSVDRIHNSVKGWGTFGANANNAIHSFTCSKCHAPHNSSLNRLMVTNCLNFTHRGRVASGGSAGSHSGSGSGWRGSGEGAGQFPAGGGGRGDSPDDHNLPHFFGTNSYPYIRQCHDPANTSETWPNGEQWNLKTPW
jgi:hypothetical protein